jgi:hypothetical protein
MTDWRIENIVIYICTTVLVLALYLMSESFHSLWGLLMLLFVNYQKVKHD